MARRRADPSQPVLPREVFSLTQVARKGREEDGRASGDPDPGLSISPSKPRNERDRGEPNPEQGNGRREGARKQGRGWSPMARAVAMLARREHSQAEIVRKLLDKGIAQDEARRVVDELARLGLQSDQRFLESRVRQRVGGGYGPGRARMDLARHGLDEEAVERAVSEPGEGWQQGAYDLVERRFGPSPLPYEVRNKALGLLVRRGFSFDQAQQVIRQPRPEKE